MTDLVWRPRCLSCTQVLTAGDGHAFCHECTRDGMMQAWTERLKEIVECHSS